MSTHWPRGPLFCFFVVHVIQVLGPTPSSGNSDRWEVVAGEWEAGADAGGGRAGRSDWSYLLSREWYGDFEFSGVLESRTRSGSTAVLLRYAGETESYALVLDWQQSRVYFLENHFGESRTATETPMQGLAGHSAANFRIAAKGNQLIATLWRSDQRESEGVSLGLADVKVPEGRLGLGVRNGEISYSGLQLSGNTKSSFSTYAFRCNYRLPDKLSGEAIWQYLDAVGSSLLTRFPRNFRSVGEYEEYKKSALLQLRQSLGLDPWPERTPLNARVVGTVDRSDFWIEKVIFESHPGFLVNALLYLPKKVELPVPGILSPIGHYSDDGFFLWSEQGRCLGLVKKGYVVLTYDPIGQGERKWLGNANHDTLRKKIILSGMEVSGLMFWDSIRAIDYLVSRPEVDPERIGVTGVSGGGFNTIYTAILDERVRAAAPDGFTSTMESLIKRGSAGCCAYHPNLTRYAEMQDVYSLAAPRKLLILGGYMDVLSDRLLPIFEAARKIYKLYGAEDSIQYFLDRDAGHTYSKPMRLVMYRWFNKWLRNIDDPAEAREARDPEDFLISRDSGLLKVFAPGERGKDVVDLEREYLAKNRVKIDLPESPGQVSSFQQSLRKKLIELMGDIEPARPPVVVKDDRFSSPGSVRRVLLKTERDLPVLLEIHHPGRKRNAGTLLVYFTMEDRYPTADLPTSEVVARLVEKGFTVAVPQVRGTGPTGTQDMNSVMLFSMVLGKHLFSTRIYDLQRAIDLILAQPEYKSLRLALLGEGAREGVMALYLAAIDPRVQTVVSSHGLFDYQHIVDQDGLPDFDYYVPGLLKYTDVAQIAAAVAPRRAIISSPVDINGKLLGIGGTRKAYEWTQKVYQVLGRPAEFLLLAQRDLIDALAK